MQLKNNQLKVELPSDREVLVTRAFNAPVDLVWDAHTKPELVKRWMTGPDGWSMPVCEIDLRVGGAYRYRWRNDADGSEFGSGGVHKEVATPTRVVTTERMEGFQGEATNTLVLREAGGKTIVTLTMDFGSKEARDGAVATGMTDGMELGYQRLDAMFAK
jgi:uncharacterized protein YndB with AHSA1/START domain